MTNSTIHTNVMRRVRTIHALRSASAGAGAAVLLFILSLYLIGREVWVARVWQNMPSLTNIQAFARFFLSAFVHTSIVVQALLLLTIFAGLWFIRELARLLSISSVRRQVAA